MPISVTLVKVSTHKKPTRDSDLNPSAAISKELGVPKDGEASPSEDGTWCFSAREPATIVVRKRKEKVIHHRICWMEGSTARRAADLIPSNSTPSFNKAQNVAYVTASEARVYRIFLDSGRVEQVQIEGVQFDPEDTSPAFMTAHALDDGRLIVQLAAYPARFLLCEPKSDHFQVAFETALLGEFALVRGRVLVGGGLPLIALAFTKVDARVIAQFPKDDCERVYIVNNVPRFYSKAGCFEMRGLDDAYEQFQKDPGRFAPYPGWKMP